VTDHYWSGTIFRNRQPISTHFEDRPGWAHDAPQTTIDQHIVVESPEGVLDS